MKILKIALLLLLVTSKIVAEEPTLYHQEPSQGEYSRGEDSQGEYVLYADNPLATGVFFYITAQLTNIESSIDLPATIPVPAATNREVLTFRIIDSTISTRLSYQYRYGYGDPHTAKHDDSYRYLFPYGHGTKHDVSQGYFGTFSHFKAEDVYSLDFNMPLNTPIHAAREGVVIKVKEDSRRGGVGARYAKDGNYIMIMHSDGSFAHYVHLVPNGAIVVPQQYVAAGEHIGFSGNTGNSSGPHLHFDVRVPTLEGIMQTVPIKFIHLNNETVEAHKGNFYYSVHSNGAPFEPIIGRNLRAGDYFGYLRSIPASSEIDFRTERIDNSFVGFISNGLNEEKTVRVEFQLRGVTAELENPIILTIPAQAEVFCNIFHSTPNSTRISIRPRIQFVTEPGP